MKSTYMVKDPLKLVKELHADGEKLGKRRVLQVQDGQGASVRVAVAGGYPVSGGCHNYWEWEYLLSFSVSRIWCETSRSIEDTFKSVCAQKEEKLAKYMGRPARSSEW